MSLFLLPFFSFSSRSSPTPKNSDVGMPLLPSTNYVVEKLRSWFGTAAKGLAAAKKELGVMIISP